MGPRPMATAGVGGGIRRGAALSPVPCPFSLQPLGSAWGSPGRLVFPLKIPEPACTGNSLGASLQSEAALGPPFPTVWVFSHRLQGGGLQRGKASELLASWSNYF